MPIPVSAQVKNDVRDVLIDICDTAVHSEHQNSGNTSSDKVESNLKRSCGFENVHYLRFFPIKRELVTENVSVSESKPTTKPVSLRKGE
jgi:hypothetical protein